jgi:hypothetical protein
VLKLLNEGFTMREIAANPRVTARTVAFHKYRIMAVPGAKNITELLQFSDHDSEDREPHQRGHRKVAANTLARKNYGRNDGRTENQRACRGNGPSLHSAFMKFRCVGKTSKVVCSIDLLLAGCFNHGERCNHGVRNWSPRSGHSPDPASVQDQSGIAGRGWSPPSEYCPSCQIAVRHVVPWVMTSFIFMAILPEPRAAMASDYAPPID